jgi:predicted sulfurtransferase
MLKSYLKLNVEPIDCNPDKTVKEVYIFDDRMAVTINSKDVTETVTLAELKSSDLDCFAPTKKWEVD